MRDKTDKLMIKCTRKKGQREIFRVIDIEAIRITMRDKTEINK